MNFKVGDKAVYPGYGPGHITSIETKEISGAKQKFYSIMIMNSDTKIMVPESQVQVLRSIITRSEAKKVLDLLKDPQSSESLLTVAKNWNKRYQQYTKIIKTGNVFNIARILRDLLNIEEDKGLSFYEKRLMFTVCKMLFDEISTVIEEKEMQKTLDFSGLLAQFKQ